MTVSTEACSSVHLICTDDVPHEPHHIRCLQHDQQLLILASRSFCDVLANQRPVAATTDIVRRVHGQRTVSTGYLIALLVREYFVCR